MSPFEALNLRVNPFGASLAPERGALLVPTVDVDALARWVAVPRRAVQFVGKVGRGKSTHLSALHDVFPGEPITCVPERGPAPPIPPAPVVFVDEAQRLSVAARWRLFRREASFVVATHTSSRASLWLAGVEVKTVRVDGLSLGGLHAYVARRMAWARGGAGPVPRVPAALLRELRARHGSDVRAIERDLYHWLEDRRSEGRAVR